MRKPRSKHAKANSHHVLPLVVTHSCGSRATSVVEHAICLLGTRLADGQVYGTCRRRKCFADFQAFVQQVIVPEALQRRVREVALILDNGSTHARYPTGRLVA